jgi:hypothetical protein
MKRLAIRTLLAASAWLANQVCLAGGLEQFTGDEIANALRSSLRQGAVNAVVKLAKPDAFFADPKLRIPLPEPMQKAEGTLRTIGMGKELDALETAMNRAAEAAIPKAKKLVLGAVTKMTVADAKAIFSGPDDAVTQFFRKHTERELQADFLPAVSKVVQRVELAGRYNKVVERAAAFGLLEQAESVENYVTRKALNGLYATMAEEERALRKDPVKATTNLLKKVLESIRFGTGN